MSLSSKISSKIKSNISKISSHKYKNIIIITLILAIIVILYLIITTFFLDKKPNNANRKEPFESLIINNNTYSVFNPPENKRRVSTHWDLNINKPGKTDCSIAKNTPNGYPKQGFYDDNEKATCWPGYDHISSMLDTKQGWTAVNTSQLDTAKKNNVLQTTEWLQMDLDSVISVVGIVTQGRGLGINNTGSGNQMVLSYTVQYSNDNKTWIPVDNNNVFFGNTVALSSANPNDKRGIPFSKPISAQYIRIFPQSYNGDITMRAGVLVHS